MNIELTDSKHQLDRIERILQLVLITVLDVAFIIGISQITVKVAGKLPFIFYVYLLGTIICTLWLLYKLILSRFDNLQMEKFSCLKELFSLQKDYHQ